MTDKPQPVGPTPQTLRGRIASVVFHNAENDFAVVRVTPKGHEGTGVLRTVVGMLHGARAGEEIEVTGKPLDDPKFGPQFRAESCRLLEPSDEDSIVTYLSSGLIPGVGPATAQRIVDTFGQSTLRVLDEDPGRMREVPGKCSALTPQTSHFSGRKCGHGLWLSSIVPVTRCARRPSLSPPIVAIERRRVAGLKATASSRGSSCSSAARRAIGQGAGG